jgi:hypothetical protein
VTYYTTAAFRGSIVGGSHKPMDGEFSYLRYFSRSECDSLDMSPSSRLYFQTNIRGRKPAIFRISHVNFPRRLIDPAGNGTGPGQHPGHSRKPAGAAEIWAII